MSYLRGELWTGDNQAGTFNEEVCLECHQHNDTLSTLDQYVGISGGTGNNWRADVYGDMLQLGHCPMASMVRT